MIKIAHRGNLDGPSWKENQPQYLIDSIDAGYDIELDLWRVSNYLWLGHDGPQYLVTESFLLEIGHAAWIHCKNLDALHFLNTTFPQLNYFWHQGDDYTMTSQGYIWAYPNKDITGNVVIVDLDNSNYNSINAMGVCSDYAATL